MRVELNRVNDGTAEWYWRLMGRNGKIIAVSETYDKKGNALRTAKKIAHALKVPITLNARPE